MSFSGESPLLRAGLFPGPSSVHSVEHSHLSIRQKTVQLSNSSEAEDYESDDQSMPPSPTENTSLLPQPDLESALPLPPTFTPTRSPEKQINTLRVKLEQWGVTAAKSIPAVLLGSLLNILDGVSYGMIIFPAYGIFEEENMAPLGVSMFFLSTLLSQLTYTLGASQFPGANGSMMIEVVPFFHLIAMSIAADLETPGEILATTLVSYALSSILTGLAFFLLGYLKLGTVIGFFPRHILVGCIGGVGAFLLETGLEVSLSLTSTETSTPLSQLFTSVHNVILWTVPLFLAVFLRVGMWAYTKLRKDGGEDDGQGIFVGYFVAIPMIFYIVVLAAGIPIDTLRDQGWIFDVRGGGDSVGWYKFYDYYDFRLVRFKPIWDTLPTQFALLFFNILHPPLNVPALSVSLCEDSIDTNRELLAHGYSNFLAGIFGTVPNYLVYVNTLLFYRVGGTTRISGFMLAIATTVLLAAGTAFVGFIPIMVVGALIFVLGIDLVKEAVWDTRTRVSRSEYLTIVSIMVCMTVFDFVIGVLFGIVVCCLFFVIQTSRLSVIRALHTGSTAPSTVRRPSAQRAYIREVSGTQTCVMRLGGFMFFGNVREVEEGVSQILGISAESQYGSIAPVKTPGIRFLVLDLTHVVGVDMSALEGLVRVRRTLEKRGICLVICGVRRGQGPVGRALDSFFGADTHGHGVRSLSEGEGAQVEVFDTFGNAMEWTENAYLRVWFRTQQSARGVPFSLPGRQDGDITPYHSDVVGSPRRSQLYDAGTRTIANEHYPTSSPSINALLSDHVSSPGSLVHYNSDLLHAPPRKLKKDPPAGDHPLREPLPTLQRTFSSYTSEDLSPLVPFLQRVSYPAGHTLWRQNDPADGLYVIEKGVLRALYVFESWDPEGSADRGDRPRIEESMVSGTLAGELTALSNMPRNATMIVERDVIMWKLSREGLKRMQEAEPAFARIFVEAVLKAAKIDYDILLAALATRQ